MLTNKDRWLMLLMKKGTLTFSDLKGAVDRIYEGEGRLRDILDIPLPASVGDEALEYKAGDRHGLFHQVLNDLDALVGEGLAARSMERTGEDEFEERFIITSRGVGRVGAIIVELQDGDFKVLG